MPRRNAPEIFFSAVQGCPRSCARTNPWFRGQILGEKRAQEPPARSAVKHCRFLGTGGGSQPPSRGSPRKKKLAPPIGTFFCKEDSHVTVTLLHCAP